MSRCYPKRFRKQTDSDPDYVPYSSSTSSSSEYIIDQSEVSTEPLTESESEFETETETTEYDCESERKNLQSEKSVEKQCENVYENRTENITENGIENIDGFSTNNVITNLDIFDAPVQNTVNEKEICKDSKIVSTGQSKYIKIVLKTKTIIIDEDENVTIEFK
jgi:hypothetical protein